MTITLFLSLLLNAQEKTSITIVAGEDVNKVLSTSCFLFYDYQDATFYSKKGMGKVKMNYNMLTGDMMFINEGDTLALSNPQDIISITIGKQEFIYKSKNYLEILQEIDNKMLLVQRRIKPTVVKQTGAYGVTTASASIHNASGLQTTTSVYGDSKLNTTKQVVYEVVYTFYLQINNSLYTGATEKNFQKIFGANQKERISNYIKENKLNLKKEEDIIQLFNFCAGKD